MNRHIEFVKGSNKFALLAIFANMIALLAAIWWLFDSNWQSEGAIEIEPIVTVLALCATLLGLNFVNDKLTKPKLKVSLRMAMAQYPMHDLMHGISVDLENHSMTKAFIKSFKVELPESKEVLPFLYDGFTGIALPKVIIEPGQSYSFHIVKENLGRTLQDPKTYGDFIVTTDIGHKFVVPAKKFQEQVSMLLEQKT